MTKKCIDNECINRAGYNLPTENKSLYCKKHVKTIKDELVKEYNEFIIKTIQLFYNDDYEVYKQVKEENITDIVAV